MSIRTTKKITTSQLCEIIQYYRNYDICKFVNLLYNTIVGFVSNKSARADLYEVFRK